MHFSSQEDKSDQWYLPHGFQVWVGVWTNHVAVPPLGRKKASEVLGVI